MAEIAESSDTSPDPPAPKSDRREEFDPETMRRTKPGAKRLVLTLSVLVSFLIGFPFLWKSVEIYRAPLLFDDIDSLSKRMESEPLQFPCNFRAVFVGFDFGSEDFDRADDLKSSIANRMDGFVSGTSQCGTCSSNYSVSVVMESNSQCVQSRGGRRSCPYQCGAISSVDFASDDESIDGSLERVLGGECSGLAGKVYTVVVVNEDAGDKAVIGKYRHAWIVGRTQEEKAVENIAEIFVKVFSNGGKEEGLIHGEFMPVGADGRIVLSFNLLNTDPQDWIYDWDFNTIEEHMLSPLVEALGPIANITVESQVLYHTPKSCYASWDDELKSFILNTGDLPFFVNSNEWHLDTSTAAGGRSKVLQLVLYIPSAKECPLNLQLPNREISKANGYISPMWGGVVVWNPKNCLQDPEKYPAWHKISPQDLQKIFEVFVAQIRQLIGLKSDNLFIGTSGRSIMLASEKGFTEWELDALTRQHTCFNLRSCATTLSSLSRLVQSLPRMIIKDEIGKQVKLSMEAAKQAESDASHGIYDAAAVSSRQSRALAEDAFFHPSIMSISYYSFEHCFAVYSPFFLPVSLHVVLAALREWKRYQRENKKYFAWKAREDAS